MAKKLLYHNEQPEHLTWDLSVLYASEADFEQDFTRLRPLAEAFAAFKGRLGESPETLKRAIEASDAFERLGEKLYTYAHLKSDENTADNADKSRVDRLSALFAELAALSSFFEPEIMAMPEERMRSFLDAPELAFYRRSLLELLRDKPHILSEKEERLLGLFSDVLGTGDEAFSVLNDADLDFGKIAGEDGRTIELGHGNYRRFLESGDRATRRRAFKRVFSTYQKFRNTFSVTLDGTVKRHAVGAKVRNYPDSLAAALSDDNIPCEVYTNLIAAVHAGLPALDRYLELRRRVLNLPKLDMYDLYNPLTGNCRAEYPFARARELVKAALKPLGEEYSAILDKAFSERWIDVPECRSKRSGAYSGGCFDSNPYLLLNHNDTLNDVFTLAHELGHSLHSYYSNHHQEYHYADYSIFVAEVASTTNEILLFEYLLRRNSDPDFRRYLLTQLADEIRATIYRQTMFAEFELKIHRLSEQGVPLSADRLSDEYYRLNLLYHGRVIPSPDPLIAMEWARIPHFYYDFYVYKYATGMSAAIQLARNILSGDPEKLDAYLGFLKAGDSCDVLDIMRGAGVDLSTPAPVSAALDYFGEVVTELEAAFPNTSGK